MSKITRKKLTRGVALGTDHVHDPLDAIGVADADQVKVQWAPFRVTFNFSVLTNAIKPISIPFTLPPLQQFFDTATKSVVKTTPSVILDEISFSFDSRSDVGAITEVGAQHATDLDKCSVDIAVLEKSRSTTDIVYDKEVASFRIPSAALVGSTTERMNPLFVGGLGQVIDPYKVYMLQVVAPDLASAGSTLIMPSATISLRFRHPMVAGSVTGAAQNAPDVAPKLKGSAASIGITTPPGSAVIEASHLQVEMDKVDEVFLSKLNGGFPVDATYHIDADSGYDVIAVPMFQNPFAILAKDADRLPYYTHFGTYGSFDRRIIPISEPLIIHHILAVGNHNYTGSLVATAQPPQLAALSNDVSIGIGCGIRSELFTYQQVAAHEWFPGAAIPTAGVIDRSTPNGPPDHSLELVNIPLIGSGGRGYASTGSQVYVGRGITSRTQINSTTPATGGREQFIEIRWLIKTATGAASTLGHDPTNPLTPDAGDVYVGTGGHWVYLICEKRLTGERGTHG